MRATSLRHRPLPAAIEFDPNFAMAYARLGVVYINTSQVAKADKYFAKAYALSKNVSERERLVSLGTTTRT